MPAGRPPKPTHLHLLDGTYRGDRHGDRPDAPGSPTAPAVEPLVKLPRAPEFLGDVGRREWNRIGAELLDKKLLTSADMATFAGYCASLQRAITAERTLDEQGLTMLTIHGEIVRPEVSIAKAAWTEVRKFAQEFGITPAARTRVRPAPAKPDAAKADDPWADVMPPVIPPAKTSST